MARAKNGSNGHLDEAMAKLAESHASLDQELKESKLRWERGQTELRQSTENLLQSQTQLVQLHVAFMHEQAAFRTEMSQFKDETARHFQHLETILLDHSRVLERLPEAVREKIGFKAPPT